MFYFNNTQICDTSYAPAPLTRFYLATDIVKYLTIEILGIHNRYRISHENRRVKDSNYLRIFSIHMRIVIRKK